MLRPAVLLIGGLSAVAAGAEDAPRHIPPEEWRALVDGRVLHYEANGGYVGREYYLPGSNRARFESADGTCGDGVWTYLEESRAYCFRWPWGTFCFHHLERADGTLAISTVTPAGDPVPSTPQDIVSITKDVFICGTENLS